MILQDAKIAHFRDICKIHCFLVEVDVQHFRKYYEKEAKSKHYINNDHFNFKNSKADSFETLIYLIYF